MATVSVIIPTYKGAENVSGAVESIYSQTFKDIEIIVVDDNGEGTEEQTNTEKALAGFMAMPNFKYIKHKTNLNGSTARNTGAKSAVGKYIFFIDDDDKISEDDIEAQVNCMENQDESVAMSYSSSKIYVQGEYSNTIYAKKSGRILYDYLMGKVFIGTGCYLLRRKVWEEIGGYDESFLRHQDWEFIARILDRYSAVTVSDVYFYRNIINRNTPAKPKSYEAHADKFIEFLQVKIHSISKRKIRNVINLNNSRVAVQYLKNRDISGVFGRMKKYDNFFAAYWSLFRLVVSQSYNRIAGRRS